MIIISPYDGDVDLCHQLVNFSVYFPQACRMVCPICDNWSFTSVNTKSHLKQIVILILISLSEKFFQLPPMSFWLSCTHLFQFPYSGSLLQDQSTQSIAYDHFHWIWPLQSLHSTPLSHTCPTPYTRLVGPYALLVCHLQCTFVWCWSNLVELLLLKSLHLHAETSTSLIIWGKTFYPPTSFLSQWVCS